MVREYVEKSTQGRFIMNINNTEFRGAGILNTFPFSVNTLVYNNREAQQVIIDEIAYTMPSNSILPLMPNQNFSFERPNEVIAWQFNREFYCIADHDAEVGCVGFLFYGIQHPMFISLSDIDKEAIFQLEKVFSNEWQSQDNFQGEMLRTLLKHLIIKTTRIAKQQSESYLEFSNEKMDIVRKFSLLLEVNFKKEHSVNFYASALNKSPKTLSNFFALLKQPPPSKLIQKRIIQEAQRYLNYTDKAAKEISFNLGFESPAHFSRFFKLYSGNNVSEFKNLKSLVSKIKKSL